MGIYVFYKLLEALHLNLATLISNLSCGFNVARLSLIT